jgi:hypothetical protein
MEWVRDRSGRFPERPHFAPDELDAECERLITEFLQRRHNRVEFPVTTDDLTVLIEGVATDLDMYANLSDELGEVEGVTEFRPGQKPRVRISANLTNNARLENRLRTTLTHEFGHIHFHRFLFELQPQRELLFPVGTEPRVNKCKRETIIGAKPTDWMEWQAGYACGALLMPRGALRQQMQALSAGRGLSPATIGTESSDGVALIAGIALAFGVSRDAARVRLVQRDCLIAGAGNRQPGLFRAGGHFFCTMIR